MTEVVPLKRPSDDVWWAVVASMGRVNRVADIYADRASALANRAWREQQVTAYAGVLTKFRAPAPTYTVTQIRRAELPRGWRPLPALGFLRGRFI